VSEVSGTGAQAHRRRVLSRAASSQTPEQAVDIAPPGASLVQPSHYFMMEGARALRRVDLAPLAGREG
jgi:hypothetical protein